MKMPWPERDAKWPVVVDSRSATASAYRLATPSLLAIHTPGHAPDHLCFWHEASRTVFCGDLAIKGTSVWIPARLGGESGGVSRLAGTRSSR